MLEMLFPRRCVLCLELGTALCGACATTLPAAPELAPPPGFEACASLLSYEGPTRELVAALKFRNHRDAVASLGSAMALLVDRHVDAVTWAPTSPARRRARGFDQAELLAVAVARSLRHPCRPSLRRLPGQAQTGHGRQDRLQGPRFAAIRRPPEVLLVVDDVRTTGATLCAAADALTEAGATTLVGLTLAVTL